MTSKKPTIVEKSRPKPNTHHLIRKLTKITASIAFLTITILILIHSMKKSERTNVEKNWLSSLRSANFRKNTTTSKNNSKQISHIPL